MKKEIIIPVEVAIEGLAFENRLWATPDDCLVNVTMTAGTRVNFTCEFDGSPCADFTMDWGKQFGKPGIIIIILYCSFQYNIMVSNISNVCFCVTRHIQQNLYTIQIVSLPSYELISFTIFYLPFSGPIFHSFTCILYL